MKFSNFDIIIPERARYMRLSTIMCGSIILPLQKLSVIPLVPSVSKIRKQQSVSLLLLFLPGLSLLIFIFLGYM